jgi:adenylate kinase
MGEERELMDHHIRYVTDLMDRMSHDYKGLIDDHTDKMRRIMDETMVEINNKLLERINSLEARLFLLEKKND